MTLASENDCTYSKNSVQHTREMEYIEHASFVEIYGLKLA